jgi:putative acetyltransferase
MDFDEARMTIERPEGPEVEALLAERDAHFDRLYADKAPHLRGIDLKQDNLVFFTARSQHGLLACGALLVHPDYGELKRFYVREAFRGRGLGRRLVQAIEAEARRRGLAKLMLEVGVRQSDAAALYRSEGFQPRDRFGQYQADPLNAFMEKTL